MNIQMVPRIEDLPYHSSPPIEFSYSSQASFSAGQYIWADTPQNLNPIRPLMVNSLYYFRSITMVADIEESVYNANLVTVPSFQMYLKSRKKSILFREAVYMSKFLQNFDYKFAWFTQQNNDQLYAGFTGILGQNADLVGKATITLTAVISAQEVVDEGFIKLFKETYPST